MQNLDLKTEKNGVARKRIDAIWDDPSGRAKSYNYSVQLEEQDRFLENIALAQGWLRAVDSTLSQLNDFIVKVREIVIQMSDKTLYHEVYKQAADEVEEIFHKIMEALSSKYIERYTLFGSCSMTPSIQKESGEFKYSEECEKLELNIEPGFDMTIDLVGTSFLTKPLKILGEDFDLDPRIEHNTRLSDLNRGKGVNLGSIRVTIGNTGVFKDINLHHAVTVGDVIDAINFSEITGLNAGITESKKGLKLTYTWKDQSNPGQELNISEASGRTARDLGILTNLLRLMLRNEESLEGEDLDPILTENTPVSSLYGGHGLTLGKVKITLGKIQKIVDLSSAATVGEIIDKLSDSIPGIIASLDSAKKGISIESTILGESLVVSDGDDKKSAHNLGISGSPDILGALLFLMEGLNNGDYEVLSESLETLNLSLEEISTHQSETEAKLKRVENIEARLRHFQPDIAQLLSELTQADTVRATAYLADQQSTFESALQKRAAMIQPEFLNFIR